MGCLVINQNLQMRVYLLSVVCTDPGWRNLSSLSRLLWKEQVRHTGGSWKLWSCGKGFSLEFKGHNVNLKDHSVWSSLQRTNTFKRVFRKNKKHFFSDLQSEEQISCCQVVSSGSVWNRWSHFGLFWDKNTTSRFPYLNCIGVKVTSKSLNHFNGLF